MNNTGRLFQLHLATLKHLHTSSEQSTGQHPQKGFNITTKYQYWLCNGIT
jgi:hypothetical protein